MRFARLIAMLLAGGVALLAFAIVLSCLSASARERDAGTDVLTRRFCVVEFDMRRTHGAHGHAECAKTEIAR